METEFRNWQRAPLHGNRVQKLAMGSCTWKQSSEIGKGLIYMEIEFRNWQRAHLCGNKKVSEIGKGLIYT